MQTANLSEEKFSLCRILGLKTKRAGRRIDNLELFLYGLDDKIRGKERGWQCSKTVLARLQ
jgi:hypothetical protein